MSTIPGLHIERYTLNRFGSIRAISIFVVAFGSSSDLRDGKPVEKDIAIRNPPWNFQKSKLFRSVDVLHFCVPLWPWNEDASCPIHNTKKLQPQKKQAPYKYLAATT